LAGDASVYAVTESGDISTFFDGVTASTGIAVETSGEASGGLPFAVGTGRIVELDSAGLMLSVVASGLTLPISLTIGPGGASRQRPSREDQHHWFKRYTASDARGVVFSHPLPPLPCAGEASHRERFVLFRAFSLARERGWG